MTVVDGYHATFLVMRVEVLIQGHADGCDSLIGLAAFLCHRLFFFNCCWFFLLAILALESNAKELEEDVEQ